MCYNIHQTQSSVEIGYVPIVLCFILGLVQTNLITEETVLLSKIETVVDAEVKLPCNLRPPVHQDDISLILWYKNGAKSPIYSMDVRRRSLNQSIHWFDERLFNGRASYSASPPLSFLTLEHVRDTDAGVYKCRVDFKHSPTRNYIVNLTVIVPPKFLTILDSTGSVIEHSTIGPVKEGATLEINCVAEGGVPAPRVTWWKDGELVDDSDSAGSDRSVSNTYMMQRVTRQNFGSILTCQAINSPSLAPLTATFTVQVLLPPLDVRIVDERKPFSAGSEYDLTCHSSGSRPPATITWWKGGKQIQAPTKVSTGEEGNLTICTVTYLADVNDAGLFLSCRASNLQVSTSALEDTWQIDVHFLPIVTVELGSNLNSNSVREGMDLYLECSVRSNPPVRKVVWMHNDLVVHNNATAGTILSNQTLVLQSVTRKNSGSYVCIAGNSEGETESKAFVLDVKYEPQCLHTQQRVYGASRLEVISVMCEVDANPAADWFRWSFNNSAVRSRDIQSFVSDKGGGRSVATYVAKSEVDYGTLLCWGRNGLGSQTVPCVFHIVPAGRPEAPYNCSASNRSRTWVQVVCTRGFDGGLPQHFVAEVRDNNGRLVSNMSRRSDTVFTLTELMPGAEYVVTVYSRNGKGRSPQAANISVCTLEQAQVVLERHSTEASDTEVDVLVLVMGTISGILFLTSVLAGAVACLKRNTSRSTKQLEKARSQILAQGPASTVDVIPQTVDVEIATSELPEHPTNICLSSCSPTKSAVLHSHTVPEDCTAKTWQKTAWPSGSNIKHAETQTQNHKESTV